VLLTFSERLFDIFRRLAGDSGPEEEEEGAPRVKAPLQPTKNREMFPVIESVGAWIELLSPPLTLSLFRGSIDGLNWVSMS
jgi:hypothetical protein